MDAFFVFIPGINEVDSVPAKCPVRPFDIPSKKVEDSSDQIARNFSTAASRLKCNSSRPRTSPSGERGRDLRPMLLILAILLLVVVAVLMTHFRGPGKETWANRIFVLALVLLAVSAIMRFIFKRNL
jgi:hypothetical protein